MTSRFDYLRITFKPESIDIVKGRNIGKFTLDQFMASLRVTFCLEQLMRKMKDTGRFKYYAHRFTYENINLLVPKSHRFVDEGVCLEMSSTGFDYFNEYLDSIGLDLRSWIGMVRTLCAKGYIINIPRVDYAFDDICFRGEPTTISLKRVIRAIENGELCCKARVWSDMGSDFNRICSFASKHKRIKGKDIHGVTVQLGARQSGVICRFYDKYAEQTQKGLELPKECTAWTRFELEVHDGKALCIINNFIDYTPEKFAEYICGVALEFVRFVERTSDNVTRCVTRRWWREFLNGASRGFALTVRKPSRSAFARFQRKVRKQDIPSFAVLFSEWGVVRTVKWLKSMIADDVADGRVVDKKELRENLRDGLVYYDMFGGFDRVLASSDCTPEQLREAMERNEDDYRRRCRKAGAYSGRV